MIPTILSVGGYAVKAGRNLKKMNSDELKGLLEDVIKSLGEDVFGGEFEEPRYFKALTDKQQPIACALIETITEVPLIEDFWKSMFTLCTTGTNSFSATPEDFKKAFEAVLNDLADGKFDIKFTIE